MAKISTLRDDFEDGVIDGVLWTTTGTVSESSGRAIVTPNGIGVLSAMLSNSFYDLTLSSITIQVPVATNTGTSGSLQCALAVYLDNNNIIALRKLGADLYASYTVAGAGTDNFAATYNASTHVYWRIRADSSNIYWETSATGTGTFSVQATQNIAAIFPVGAVRAYLYSIYSGAEASPGSFQIAGVNPAQQIAFSGTSTSSGSLALRRVRLIAFSGASTSAGTLSWTIPPLTFHSLTFTGASTSSGSLSLYRYATGQFAGIAASTSSGALTFTRVYSFSSTASSFATGDLTFTLVQPVTDPLLIQYFTFEPPVVFDRPAIHSKTPRHVRQWQYYSGHSPGATGVSVLKIDGQYQSIQTPTSAQIDSATKVYQGGHIYTIPQSDADELVTAGYVVTRLPVPTPFITVYPLEDLYPSEDLFPGYHDTVLA